MNGAKLVKLLAEEAGFETDIWQNNWVRISNHESVTTVHVSTTGTILTFPDLNLPNIYDKHGDWKIDLKDPDSIQKIKIFLSRLGPYIDKIDKQFEKEHQKEYGET